MIPNNYLTNYERISYETNYIKSTLNLDGIILISGDFSIVKKIAINYTTLEPFPLPSEIVDKLNYPISVKENDCFLKILRRSEFQSSDIIGVIHRTMSREKLEEVGNKLSELSIFSWRLFISIYACIVE